MAAKNFCFTIPNYTDEIVRALDALPCVYLCYGYEVCPNTGTPHLQGYISFERKRKYKKLAQQLKAHFEVMKGTPQEASDYCKKDGMFEERGVLPKD